MAKSVSLGEKIPLTFFPEIKKHWDHGKIIIHRELWVPGLDQLGLNLQSGTIRPHNIYGVHKKPIGSAPISNACTIINVCKHTISNI